MNIPIQVSGKRLDKFTKVFFNYLQKDKEFYGLVMKARKDMHLENPSSDEPIMLDITYFPKKTLRSEIKNIEGLDPLVVYAGNSKLEEALNKIINEYPFLQDWRSGLSHFICGDRFVIDSDYYPIKITVRNKKYPYKGNLTDRLSQEGVKIVLTGKVSKREVKRWLDNNFGTINKLLDELPSVSKNDPRRTNYDRDRLIVYLRDKWRLTWGDIVKILASNGELETDYKNFQAKVIKAYKQFPSK